MAEAEIIHESLSAAERLAFDHMLNAVVYGRVLYQGDEAVDWIYLYVNEAFHRTMPLRDVIGRRVTELIPRLRELDPEVLPAYGRVARGGGPIEVERYLNALGEWAKIRVYSPAPEHFVAIFDVVSEHKRAEAARKSSEALFRSMFEDAAVGMGRIDPPTGRFLNVNPSLCTLLGYSREELLTRTWREVTAADDTEADAANLEALRMGVARSYTREKRYRRKDGSIIEARLTVSASRSDASTEDAEAFMAIVEDLSTSRRLERRTRELDDQLAAVLRHAGVGFIVTRLRDEVVLRVNDAFADMMEMRADALVGRRSQGEGTWASEEERAAHFASVRAGVQTQPREVRVRARSGRVRTLLASTSISEIDGEPCMVSVLQDVTELREKDRAIRESEEELRAIVEDAPIGIAYADTASGRLLLVNDRLAKLIGRGATELVGTNVAELAHADEREAWTRLLAEAQPHRTLERVRLASSSATPVWVDVQASVLHRDSLHSSRTLLLVEDVTRLLELDEERRIAARMFEIQPDGVILSDDQGTILRVNPARERLTGYSAAELVGKNASVLRGEPEEFYKELWKKIRQGEVWHGEVRIRAKDGAVHHELMTIAPVGGSSGATTRVLASGIDVSERRAILDALRTSEERYRALIQNLEEVVFTEDLSGRISFVNRSIESYGFDPIVVLGKRLGELAHPGDAHLFERDRPDQMRAPREWRLVDTRGKVHFIRCVSRPIVTDGAVSGRMGVLSDLTRQRETEEQLRAAQKMEAVGRLAGGVAHDFNNLLSVILTYTEFALEAIEEGSSLGDELKPVINAATRAAELTRQLLAFSRHQVLELEMIAVNDLVRSFAKMLERVIGEDIQLRIEPGEDLHATWADRGQLEQVLMNLIVNARDAMPDGGRITITTSNALVDESLAGALGCDAGVYVQISVTDTGSGMNEATRARIFEPFFTTKGVGKGTGLGLSTVYGIVKQTGGAIAVESEPGRGTTFRVYLPRHSESHPPATSSAAAPRASRRGHEMLLVVEDEAALRGVLHRALVAEGYDVLLASNADEAKAIASRTGRSIDLVITDVVMPGQGGFALVDELASLCPRARVLFMSGYTDAIAQHDAPGARFLRKPFSRKTLAEKVRSVLDDDAARSDARDDAPPT